MAEAPAPARERILTVSELNRRIKAALEGYFPGQWVRGEISDYKKAGSGHFYFCLKDRHAQIDCVIYAKEAARLKFEPKTGMAVDAYGRVSVFEPRGRYQLVAETMRPAGMGDRLLALEELKKRLQAEGLFSQERKRALPRFPRRVGIVTSDKGAVIRDLTHVLRARWPSIGIVLAPVKVQGEGASVEIADAIRRFNRYGAVDVLIVARGGGSIEDLWSFNEEPVARAIFASRIPVISGVGHEGDNTLADLVADVRAATPTHAAQIAVPDRGEIGRRIDALRRHLDRAARHGIETRRQRLDRALEKYGFKDFHDVFDDWRHKIEAFVLRIRQQIRRSLDLRRRRLDAASGAYGLREWPRALVARRQSVEHGRARMSSAMQGRLARLAVRSRGYADRLRALSPRLVMERGYCLVRGPDGRLLRAAAGLAVGDPIQVEFARGEADARIEKVRTGDEHGP